jgi:hypothetical protein
MTMMSFGLGWTRVREGAATAGAARIESAAPRRLKKERKLDFFGKADRDERRSVMAIGQAGAGAPFPA